MIDAAIAWAYETLTNWCWHLADAHRDYSHELYAAPSLFRAALWAWAYGSIAFALYSQWRFVRRLFSFFTPASTVVDDPVGHEHLRDAPHQLADGCWYKNTYDSDTGEMSGKKRVEPPASAQPLTLVQGSRKRSLR